MRIRYSQAVTKIGIGNERISFRQLPATKAICIYHKGAYDRLGEAYAYIYRYAMENGYQITGLHVCFEHIHPFDDYNGRVGRLLMIKECLRHNIVPFIVDDKHRGSYNKGIKCWSTNQSVLREACIKAQERFKRQLELQRLLQRHRGL